MEYFFVILKMLSCESCVGVVCDLENVVVEVKVIVLLLVKG